MTKRTLDRRARRHRAHRRVRGKVMGTPERPRLAVYKSLRYVYAQLINDLDGTTLAQATSREESVGDRVESSGASRQAARLVGETLAERAQEKGISKVVFDRSGYVYHGRVKELAEGARDKGLVF